MSKRVNVPGFFWVKVVDGTATSPAPEPCKGPDVVVKDPGRPPHLTEYSVTAMESGAKLQFAPAFPDSPFSDVEQARAWRDKCPQWFTDARSIHLVKVDA